ncbi:MAG TPA: response regulator [Candidatus Sulfopaludibacter sp.]|nr:response regulator [Candidatus Sulfopaludibacter sp.]
MKKVLIIEDDQIIANIYRNKFAVEGYEAEAAYDGESGLKTMRTFQPDVILLDLMLPRMSGVDFIIHLRSETDFANVPVIVFSNTYLTNMIQEAWKAGANKCLSKTNCTPKDVLEVVRQTIGSSRVAPPPTAAPGKPAAAAPPGFTDTEGDTKFLMELRQTFVEGQPAALAALRAGLQSLIKADNETAQLKDIHELYRRTHALAGNAGLAGFVYISQMSAAVEALLKELHEKPRSINTSTLRTVAAAVDFLGFLFERGKQPDNPDPPAINILVVDDEPISQRAVVYALEKAQLPSTSTADPNAALNLLAEKKFDLVFLDVDMPGMTGFELCTKLRAMPQYKKTPVVFVTALSDFDSRTSSMMAGGNDFIAKPFLFIELTVKALIHVLRARLQSAK